MCVVDVGKLRRYEVLTNERKRDVLVARKTLVGWVCQRQGPHIDKCRRLATSSHPFHFLTQQWHRYLAIKSHWHGMVY